MIFVLEFCAWTKAPRNGEPSGAFTVPVTVAPKAKEPGSKASVKTPTKPEATLVIPPFGARIPLCAKPTTFEVLRPIGRACSIAPGFAPWRRRDMIGLQRDRKRPRGGRHV